LANIISTLSKMMRYSTVFVSSLLLTSIVLNGSHENDAKRSSVTWFPRRTACWWLFKEPVVLVVVLKRDDLVYQLFKVMSFRLLTCMRRARNRFLHW